MEQIDSAVYSQYHATRPNLDDVPPDSRIFVVCGKACEVSSQVGTLFGSAASASFQSGFGFDSVP